MPAVSTSEAAAAAAAAVAAVSCAAMPAPAAAAAAANAGSSTFAFHPAAAAAPSVPLPSRPSPAPLPAHLSTMLCGEFRRRLAAQSAQQIAQAVLHTERFGSAATARGGGATTKRHAVPAASPAAAAAPSPDALLLLPALLRLLPPPGIPLDFHSLPCLWALDRQRRGGASLADLEALVARSSQHLLQLQQDSLGGTSMRRKVQTPAHAKAILAAQQMQQMYADLCEIDEEAAAAAAVTTAADATPATDAPASRVSFTHWFLSLIVHAHPTASFKHVGLRVLYLHRTALEMLWELIRPWLPVAPAAASAAAAAAATNSSSRARQIDALSAASASSSAAAGGVAAPSASASPAAASPLQLVALDSLLAFSSAFAPCSAATSAPAAAGGLSASIAPAAALGCTSFQSFFNLLQLVSESAGLLDLEDEILDHYIPLLVVEKLCLAMEKGIKEMMRGVRGEAVAVKKQEQKPAPKQAAATAAATAAPVVDTAPVFIIHTDLELVGSGAAGSGSGPSTQQGSSFVTPRPWSSGPRAGSAAATTVGTPSPPKQPRPLQHQSSLLALPLSLSLGLAGVGGPGSSPELGSFRGSSGASSAQPSERGGATAVGLSSSPVMANSHRGSVMQPLLRNIAEEAGSSAAGAGNGAGGGMVHSSSNSALQHMQVDDPDVADELAQTGENNLGSPSHAGLAESARVRGCPAAAAGDSDDLDQLLHRPLHEIPLIDWVAHAQRRSSLAGGGSGSARAGSADDLLTPTSSSASSARPLGSATATAPRRHPGVPSLSFGGRAGTAGPASDQPLSGHIGHTRDPSLASAGRLANGSAWPAAVTSPPMIGHSHSSSVPSMPLSAASTTMGPLSTLNTAGRGSHNHLGDSSNSSAGTSLAHTPLTSPTGASYAAHLLALNPRRSTNPITSRSSYGGAGLGMEFLSAFSNSTTNSSLNNSTRVPASAKGVVPSLALALQGLNRGGGGNDSPQKSAQSTFSPAMTYTQRMQHGLLHSPHATGSQQQQHLIVGAMTYASPTRSPSFPAGSPVSPYLASQRSPHPLLTPHRVAGNTNAPESSRFVSMGPRNAELDGPLPLSHAALLSSASKLVGGAANAAAVAATTGADLAWPHHHIVHDIDQLSEQQVQQLINDGGDGDGDDSDDAGFGATSADPLGADANPSDDEADDADADADADDADLSLVDEDELSPAHRTAGNQLIVTPAATITATVAPAAPAVVAAPIKLGVPPTVAATTKIVIESPAKTSAKPSNSSINSNSSAKPTSPEVVELHRKPAAASKAGVSKAPAKVSAPSSAAAAGSKAKSPALSRQSSTAGLAATGAASTAAAAAATSAAPEKKKGVTFRPSLSKGKSSIGGGGGGGSSVSATTPPSTAASASPATAAAPATAKPPLTLMISNTLPVRGAISTPTAATSSAAAAAAAASSSFHLASPAASSDSNGGSNVHPFGATHSPDGKVSMEPFATQLAKASNTAGADTAAAAAPLIQPIPRA